MKNKYAGAAVIGGIATVFDVFLGEILISFIYQLYSALAYSMARIVIAIFNIAISFAAMFIAIKIYNAITKTNTSGGKSFGVAIGAAGARYVLTFIPIYSSIVSYLISFVVMFGFAFIISSGNNAADNSCEIDEEMSEYLKMHSKGKSRMNTGIVLMVLAMVIEIFGLVYMMYNIYEYTLGLVLIALSGPMWAVGIPFLITGIIIRTKANRNISELKNAKKQAEQYTSYQQETTPQDEYYSENSATASSTGGGYATAGQNTDYGQQYTGTTNTDNAQQYETTGSFVDIDLNKYPALDAGVTYNPNKDYQFHRAEGFVGSVPQSFVNRTFPKCPICCSQNPYWTIGAHNQMSWKGNLYMFKCSACQGVISMSMPDVTTLGNGGSGVAANPTVGLTNLIAKASSGKEAGAVYAVLESVGTSGVSKSCEGKEFKLEDMQNMFMRM